MPGNLSWESLTLEATFSVSFFPSSIFFVYHINDKEPLNPCEIWSYQSGDYWKRHIPLPLLSPSDWSGAASRPRRRNGWPPPLETENCVYLDAVYLASLSKALQHMRMKFKAWPPSRCPPSGLPLLEAPIRNRVSVAPRARAWDRFIGLHHV